MISRYRRFCLFSLSGMFVRLVDILRVREDVKDDRKN